MTQRTTPPRAALSLLAAFLLACGGGDDAPAARGEAGPAQTGAAPGAAPRSAPTAGAPSVRPLGGAGSGIPVAGDSAAIAASDGEPCAMFGLWQPCSVMRRLESAGLGPVPLGGAVRQPGLAIEGSAFRLGRGELQVYLYADSAGAIAEAARLEPRDAEPAKVRGIRPRPPAVIRSANMVALLFNNNDRQVERVQLALTAGLPTG